MLWWRVRLIYTIWKPQLRFPHTGDYSLQSHGCYKPIVCAHRTEHSPARCADLMLALCCIGGILHCVLRATTECCFTFYAPFLQSFSYTRLKLQNVVIIQRGKRKETVPELKRCHISSVASCLGNFFDRPAACCRADVRLRSVFLSARCCCAQNSKCRCSPQCIWR